MSSNRQCLTSPCSSSTLISLTCQHIQSETHDVKTFIFSLPKDGGFHYVAGQHLKFTLMIDSKEQHCCYTIASSPSLTKFIKLTIKRIPRGTVSNYFHERFSVGDNILALQPSGSFHLPKKIPNKVLLMSAGSGITPMLSMLRYMVAEKVHNQIIFVHSARSENDLIARTEIESLAKQHGNCQLIYTLTQQVNSQWQGYQGRLNDSMLSGIESINQYQVYVCGPKLFRKKAQTLLKGFGLPRVNYHFESFGERLPVATMDVSAKDDKSVDLFFVKWQKHYQGTSKLTILEQGEAAGLLLPYSCRAGSCGACKAKLNTGKVNQLSNDALSSVEQQQGYILLCSCLPLTDVIISHDSVN